MELTKQEREDGGVLDLDTKIVSTITSHGPGYLNKELKKLLVFKLINHLNVLYMPFGGIRMAKTALESYGYRIR